MAGRPRSKLRKIAKLEAVANQLGADFFRLMPAMYQERIDQSSLGAMGEAWRDAWEGVSSAYTSLKALRELLDAKANSMPSPEPCPFVPLADAEGATPVITSDSR